MIDRNFKTAVFFGDGFTQKQFVAEAFAEVPFIKVFQTNNSDELDQILKQSFQSAIFVRSLDWVKSFGELDMAGVREAGVRTYFIDEDASLTPAEVEKLSIKRIITLVNPEPELLRKKLCLYFMGKVELAKYRQFGDVVKNTVHSVRKSYFTHFKLIDGEWQMVASTHEQDPDIETLFKRSWTTYYTQILKRASELTKLEQDMLFSGDYVALVYPHPDKVSLSIIHLKKERHVLEENIKKAIQFLQQF